MVESTQPEEDLPQLTAEIERWLEGKPDDLATGFVCPACGGSIWEGQVGSLLRFRCHTGHRFSPEGFNQAQSSLLEQTLWHAVALLEQRAAFLRKLANQAAMEHRPWAAERYRLRAAELEPGTDLLRRLLHQAAATSIEPETPDT